MSPHMSPSPFLMLAHQYVSAVEAQVHKDSESAMKQEAESISTTMACKGLNVLDLASMHQIALVILLSQAPTQQEQARIARKASAFFMKTLTPFIAQVPART